MEDFCKLDQDILFDQDEPEYEIQKDLWFSNEDEDILHHKYEEDQVWNDNVELNQPILDDILESEQPEKPKNSEESLESAISKDTRESS